MAIKKIGTREQKKNKAGKTGTKAVSEIFENRDHKN